jgi:hypothetical protein
MGMKKHDLIEAGVNDDGHTSIARGSLPQKVL